MLNLKPKVNNIQVDISKILKSQKEIIDRQYDILKTINDLKKEEKLTKLDINELDNKIDSRYFDLRMFIIQNFYRLRRM